MCYQCDNISNNMIRYENNLFCSDKCIEAYNYEKQRVINLGKTKLIAEKNNKTVLNYKKPSPIKIIQQDQPTK